EVFGRSAHLPGCRAERFFRAALTAGRSRSRWAKASRRPQRLRLPKFGRMQRFAALPSTVFGKKHQIPARVRRQKGTQPPAAGVQNRLKTSPLPRLPAGPAEKAFDKCRKMCIIMFRLKTKAFCPRKGAERLFILPCNADDRRRSDDQTGPCK